jgi:hypothetical protein
VVLRGLLRGLTEPKIADPRWHFDNLVKTRRIQVQCDVFFNASSSQEASLFMLSPTLWLPFWKVMRRMATNSKLFGGEVKMFIASQTDAEGNEKAKLEEGRRDFGPVSGEQLHRVVRDS